MLNLFQHLITLKKKIMKIYVVYILSNKRDGTLYVGVTNNLRRRMIEHRRGIVEGFSKKYNLKTLVYVEQFNYVANAIAREKQIKRWHRDWKINLIEQKNPDWIDLYEEIFGSDEGLDVEIQFSYKAMTENND